MWTPAVSASATEAEQVVDVPPKLSARVRLFSTGCLVQVTAVQAVLALRDRGPLATPSGQQHEIWPPHAEIDAELLELRGAVGGGEPDLRREVGRGSYRLTDEADPVARLHLDR